MLDFTIYRFTFIQFYYLIYHLTSNTAMIRIFYWPIARFLEREGRYMGNSLQTSCSEYVSLSSLYMQEGVKSIWEWIGWFRAFVHRCLLKRGRGWITCYFIRLFLQTIRLQKCNPNEKKRQSKEIFTAHLHNIASVRYGNRDI